MVSGRLEFRYDLGSGPAIIMSDEIELGVWHKVKADRHLRDGVLEIDNRNATTGRSEGSSSHLNAYGDLYIGGVSSYDSVSQVAGTEIGFTGCVLSVMVSVIHICVYVSVCLRLCVWYWCMCIILCVALVIDLCIIMMHFIMCVWSSS